MTKRNPAILVVLLLWAQGCGFTPNSYLRARSIVAPHSGGEITAAQLLEETEREEPTRATAARVAMVQFCAMRASEVREDSYRHRTQDVALLVTGLFAAGIGAGLNAVAAIVADDLPATDNADDVLIVAGTASLAVGSIFLTVRAALPLDNLQRAERESAADFLLAALDLSEHFGATDPDGRRAFREAAQRCAEVDERVGQAYSTADSERALEQLTRTLSLQIAPTNGDEGEGAGESGSGGAGEGEGESESEGERGGDGGGAHP